MNDRVANEELARVLEQIPGPADNSASLRQLCASEGLVGESAEPLGALLASFGVLQSTNGHVNVESVRAISLSASYFLKSLAQHLRSGQTVLTNWNRQGTAGAATGDPLSGPRFLFAVEERRLAIAPQSPALRQCAVAQILIKVRRRGAGTSYLLLWDEGAARYQLPGGRRREGDATMEEVAKRELSEELSDFAFDQENRASLRQLGTIEATQISRSLGVATRYEITFFQLLLSGTKVPTAPGIRWVPEKELVNPASDHIDRQLNVDGLRLLNEQLPGGLRGLPASTSRPAHNALTEMMLAKPWEFTGIVVAVLGIVVSIILFVIGP